MVERDASVDPVPQEDRLAQSQPTGPEPERSAVAGRREASDADVSEQAQEVEPAPRRHDPARGFEVPEADALEQAIEVPIDDAWD